MKKNLNSIIGAIIGFGFAILIILLIIQFAIYLWSRYSSIDQQIFSLRSQLEKASSTISNLNSDLDKACAEFTDLDKMFNGDQDEITRLMKPHVPIVFYGCKDPLKLGL